MLSWLTAPPCFPASRYSPISRSAIGWTGTNRILSRLLLMRRAGWPESRDPLHPLARPGQGPPIVAAPGIAERRRAPSLIIRGGPLHTVHRIAKDSVAFAEIIKE